MTTPDIATETGKKNARFQNGHLIWGTILELRNTGRRINRVAIAEITSLKMGIVDDHVDRWIERDQLRRAGNGELEVIEHFPATRPITKTTLDNGMIKLEIGSEYLELTPMEARVIARDFAGHQHELAESDAASKAIVRCHELARELKDARNAIAALRREVMKDDSQQLPLLAA